MPHPTIEVETPSRLHFGMFSFGQPGVRQFGGVGAMISGPGLKLRFSPSDRLAVSGSLSQRATVVAERVSRNLNLGELPACRIEIVHAAPEHVGLGTGTQLALAVAAGLRAFLGLPQATPAELAALAGRAERSAIGSYGFAKGGLLVEAGKLPGDTIGPLVERIELPDAWRFVFIWPNDDRGLSGEEERSAFRGLPPVPSATTERLLHVAHEELLPAARGADFHRFGESVYRFGHAAGMCFAARQGGPFASRRIERLVETIRGLGVPGVGQTSWGPAVFALLESDDDATEFAERLRGQLDPRDTLLTVAPNNTGARIARLEP